MTKSFKKIWVCVFDRFSHYSCFDFNSFSSTLCLEVLVLLTVKRLRHTIFQFLYFFLFVKLYKKFLHSGRSRISRRAHPPRRGPPTPDAATFRKICMSKRKNLDPKEIPRIPHCYILRTVTYQLMAVRIQTKGNRN